MRSDQNETVVNLALQGGGSHGAFTWGVLDRLLEEGDLRFDGLSGTSAGAVNAALMLDGWAEGGRDRAREKLKDFWTAVGEFHAFTPFRRHPIDVWMGRFGFDLSLSYHIFASFSHLISPYQWNPTNINPVRGLLESHINFDRLRRFDSVKLFVSATCVETGRIRVFRREELDLGAMLASTALPLMFHAPEVDGQHYWDGGFVGNPALYPIFYECEATDLVIVQINPLRRDAVPKTVFEIQDRMSEIAFNASLASEMRAIHFVNRLIEKGALNQERYRRVLIHRIEAEDEMRPLGSATKLLIEPEFLQRLFGFGRAAAERWLQNSRQKLGRESTVDIPSMYLAHK